MTIEAATTHWKPDQPIFYHRQHAGELLSYKLIEQYGKETLKGAAILGCPRGGAVIAKAVEETLKKKGVFTEIGLIICRKIPDPKNPEFGIGGVTESGSPFLIESLQQEYQLDQEPIASLAKEVQIEVKRRLQTYRPNGKQLSLENRIVIVVDDAVGNGVTAIAAIKSIQEITSSRILFATPVTGVKAKDRVCTAANLLKSDFCEVTSFSLPPGYTTMIDDFYHPNGFSEVTDAEVLFLTSSK